MTMGRFRYSAPRIPPCSGAAQSDQIRYPDHHIHFSLLLTKNRPRKNNGPVSLLAP